MLIQIRDSPEKKGLNHMIKLNRAELKDKIYACWLGKNIGGTLGTPYEGQQKVHDIKGYNSPPGNPLPNDDLDLQIIWLRAMREVGPQNLNARILGEYWMEYITPFWNEYGICKANMAHGLSAPMSGEYNNSWKHSNGAWIRTEVWACLYPANVEKAIYFAYQDACVDHGMGEGTYAAIFVAALESAAFVVSDIRELIKIGLSKIPSTCRFHKAITMVCDAYDSGKTWLEARELVTNASLEDKELGWFQAPANVAYAIIGLLYGEGDFKQSLIISVNCGDDTDCSAATAGSILGIIGGAKVIPEDWKQYIGDSIVTVAINRGNLWGWLPATCTDLSNTIIETHAITMFRENVCVTDGESEVPEDEVAKFKGSTFADSIGSRSPYHLEYNFTTVKAIVEFNRAPDMKPNDEIEAKITLKYNLSAQKQFNLRWILPEGWTVEGPSTVNTTVYRWSTPTCVTCKIKSGELVSSKNRGVLEITTDARAEVGLIPLIFFS